MGIYKNGRQRAGSGANEMGYRKPSAFLERNRRSGW